MAWAMCYSIARLIATMPGNSMSNGMVQLVLGGLWNQPAILSELLCILGTDGCAVTTTVEACGRAVAWFRKCSTGSSQQIFQECTVGSSSDLSVLLAAYHSKYSSC